MQTPWNQVIQLLKKMYLKYPQQNNCSGIFRLIAPWFRWFPNVQDSAEIAPAAQLQPNTPATLCQEEKEDIIWGTRKLGNLHGCPCMVLGGAVGRFCFYCKYGNDLHKLDYHPILNDGYVPSYNLKCIPKYTTTLDHFGRFVYAQANPCLDCFGYACQHVDM